MKTREEFLALVLQCERDATSVVEHPNTSRPAVMAAWDAQTREIERQAEEIRALRLSLGERAPEDIPEPIGCPIPGACVTVRELQRLRAEVETLRTGVPLTPENVARARVVEDERGTVWVRRGKHQWATPWAFVQTCGTSELLRRGASVLVWRK